MRLDLDKLEKAVGEFEIVVDGKESKVDVKKVCGIDMENLVEEFTKHPANYAWYSTVLSLYESRKSELENDLDLKYADLDIKVRGGLSPEEAKSIKEKNIESRIISDKDYSILKEEFLLVGKVVKRLIALVKGLEVKSNMLVQAGARARKELELDGMGR